ncbi:hypothetical protein BN1723_009305 [Verticillium longisporum]|uniref:Fe2OG dioxygenase domain-containing protein n=2 Tax=Verticillium TaxID=1036719 RepID=A0A0G4KN98_VERLO|nr:hypothetical protein HYQ44_019150 [Verticillium longisporum]CRK11171.1 hypothetical protein BN1723_009305 [Verticillium longisporum]CRK35323.1 hypothetical protein BN1708_006684 [Verticillium longisporum]
MTATSTKIKSPETYKLELASAYGSVYRDVLKTPPRDCNSSEVPIIDLSGIQGNEQERRALANVVRDASQNTGFFYIKNHGIAREKIEAAFKQGHKFFAQPVEQKDVIAQRHSKFYNGWSRRGHISPTESMDLKEGFSFRYDPKYDPQEKNLDAIPPEVQEWLRGEDFVWEGTSHLPGFKDAMLAYWQACLSLARNMIKIFALALDVPEDYFDNLVTYPGSDGVINFYPRNTAAEDAVLDVGLGAHTDLQCFTFLWQDHIGGLQVLTNEGQWIKVPPIPDTFVVNIGDFLMRLSNDRFQSTVHRVFNHAPEDRISMPFFFGFNFNETCSVLPSCTDEKNPPKYEPISCGNWCAQRFAKTFTKD